MVVDDDEWMRVYLASVLESAGYEVVVVKSGKDALRRLRGGGFDILLTDCMMPEMDGLTLCRRVRAELADNIPYIVMFSVRETREARYVGLRSGADEYILKRVPRSELLAKVNGGRCIQMGMRAPELSDAATKSRQCLDPITDAHDLAYFSQQMPREIRRSRHSQRALSVLSCRLEGLENLARHYGFGLPDEIRRAFVTAVRSHLHNRGDWIARVSEDQFIVVLPSTQFKSSERLARKLHRRFSAIPIITTSGAVRCTVRIDVTACEPTDDVGNWPAGPRWQKD